MGGGGRRGGSGDGKGSAHSLSCSVAGGVRATSGRRCARSRPRGESGSISSRLEAIAREATVKKRASGMYLVAILLVFLGACGARRLGMVASQ